MFKINNKTMKYCELTTGKSHQVRLKHIHRTIKKCYSIFFTYSYYTENNSLALNFFLYLKYIIVK